MEVLGAITLAKFLLEVLAVWAVTMTMSVTMGSSQLEVATTVMTLLQDMKATQIPPKPQDDCSKCKVHDSKTCFNCNKKPCRKGKLVFRLDAPRPGTRLRSLYPDFPTTWREKYRNRLCILISRSGDDVKITWPDPPVPHDDDVSDPYQTPITTGFVYACD